MVLDNFFNPRSVAIIGASTDKTKVGYALIANLYRQGLGYSRYNRKIFPVNLTEKQILGLPAYVSVKDIPEPVDLAVIAVRADVVPQVLADCGAKKVPAAIIISAGFKEIGEAGKELEERIATIAREQNIALLGPNCLGTINPLENFNASFAAGMPPPGEIAFLSQSGALGTSLIDVAIGEGIGFSKFISLGNEASLTEIEFLEYLAQDATTKAILIYLEKLSDGPKFLELAARIAKTKPVVILRAGRSERGQAAAMSHTGSLAPGDAVFAAACRQAGVITVDSIREFTNVAKLFQLGLRVPLQKLAVLTNGGGPSVVTTDLIGFSRSLALVNLSPETQKTLREILPPMAAVGNPVDIIGDALAARFEAALKILVNEPEVEAILLIVTPQMMTEMEATAKLVNAYRQAPPMGGQAKPVIPVFLGGPVTAPAMDYFKQNNLTNFHFPKDAIEALDALARGADKSESGGLTLGGLKVGPPETSVLSFSEMKPLLDKYGIALQGILVNEKSHLDLAVNNFAGQALAMKLISRDIVHKSDAGAVKLNIKNKVEAEVAWDEMFARNQGANIEGVLVQPMTKGKEVIIGMKRDATFGPTILFGLGGIFTEVLKDTTLRIAPVDVAEAKKMILEIKAKNILTGLRGEPPVNLDALADLITKISKLSLEHPEIRETDLNPVMATPENVNVVDARIMC